MKGKKAVHAARQRESAAATKSSELDSALKRERAARSAEVKRLQDEISRLRVEHIHEAGRIAAREVKRLMAKAEEERRKRGLSDVIAGDLLYQKDKFVLNACRYLSMVEGKAPMVVIPRVMAWMLDDDFVGFLGDTNLLVKCGLPHDGWVARQLKHYKFDLRRIAQRNALEGSHSAVSLDRAEREKFEAIHSDYNPKWYPRVEYSGIVLEDDSDEVAS